MIAIPKIVRRALSLMHLFMLFIIALVLLAFTSGCAGGFGLVRMMEPPLKNIDTAELSANLPPDKALLIDYSFDSVQADQSLSAGNDSTLTMGAVKDLLSMGAGLGSGGDAAAAMAQLANKDRRIHSTIIIADSKDIMAMRKSDNASKLIQQSKVIDVVNRVVVTQEVPVVVDPVDPENPVVIDPPADTNQPPVVVDPVTPEPSLPDNSLDALDISNAKLLGNHARVNPAKIATTKLLSTADVDGSLVRLEYEALGWPDNDSGVGGNIDSRTFIFWKEGDQVVGGQFDWKRPGQTEKTLENVFGGYLEGRSPPRGSEVWFCIVKNDQTQRTNVLKSNTPYNL